MGSEMCIRDSEKLLRLASPFVPFVAEEIWQKIPGAGKSASQHLMVADFPEADTSIQWGASESWEKIQGIVTALRSVRAARQIPRAEKIPFTIELDSGLDQATVNAWAAELAGAEPAAVSSKQNTVARVGTGYKLYCKVPGFDAASEKSKIEKEIKRLDKILKGLDARLGNEKFVSNADPQVLADTRGQQQNLSSQRTSLQETMQNLS